VAVRVLLEVVVRVTRGAAQRVAVTVVWESRVRGDPRGFDLTDRDRWERKVERLMALL
jgi:hypothetical protein